MFKNYEKYCAKNKNTFWLKFSKHIKFPKKGTNIILRWTQKGSGLHHYHIPDFIFHTKEEVIGYLIEHIENDKLIIKILPVKNI